LEIGFYSDDFEVANPLGTSKGKYKLSAFYWTIANLQPDLRSSTDNIQLAALCKSSYIKHFGIEKVMQKFLEDVAVYEGVCVDSLGVHMRGTITFVATDNLAAHMLFGMAQSFGPSVSRFCRFCTATNQQALKNHAYNIQKCQFRTPANYSYHVKQIEDGTANHALYGIQSNSVFHKYLQFFTPLMDFLLMYHMICSRG
jgi:hypothetical protein